MNWAEYQPLALRTAKMFPTTTENLRHAAFGLTTEIGEFATEVKRIEIYGRTATPEMIAHMVEEIGDFCWYTALLAASLHLSMGDVPVTDLETQEQLKKMDPLTGLCATGAILAGYTWMLTCKPTETDSVESVEVLGISKFSIIEACVALGTDLGEVLAMNIDKLRLRFPDAYSDEAAEARLDKGGLTARMS